jgi:uncharacterized protein
MNIFLNANHELRAGWKFAAYWVLFIAVLVAMGLALPLPVAPENQLQRLILNTLPVIPAIIALILMARLVDRVPIAAFGVTFHERWGRDLLLGLGIAAAMLVALTLGNGILGGIQMNWNASDVTTRSLLATVFVLVMSAAQEEIIFRGYPLQVLMKGMGAWPAILTMAAAFGLVHLLNPNATIIGGINTMLAGLLLSIAYLKTRSLWLPYGLHLGWTLGLGVVLGYPLSGIEVDSLWRTDAGGPGWLVGSEYGPEDGLVGTVIFIAAALVIRAIRHAGISPRLRAVLATNAGKLYVSES